MCDRCESNNLLAGLFDWASDRYTTGIAGIAAALERLAQG